MTRTFERFLRSFNDEDLKAFAHERATLRPPYWQAMQLALRIEAGRRGLRLDDDSTGPTRRPQVDPPTREASA